jgi:tetratricopeptide (TPR) repeat protein
MFLSIRMQFGLGQFWAAGICMVSNLGMSLVNKYIDHPKQYKRAIDYYNQALQISQERDFYQCISSALIGLGDAHAGLRQYEQAVGYYQSCIPQLDVGDEETKAKALQHLGTALAKLAKYLEAHQSYQSALAIYVRRRGYKSKSDDQAVAACEAAIYQLDVQIWLPHSIAKYYSAPLWLIGGIGLILALSISATYHSATLWSIWFSGGVGLILVLSIGLLLYLMIRKIRC